MMLNTYPDRGALIAAAADDIAKALSAALEARGRASLVLSGGSSPKPVYNALARMDIPWDGVGISLVDERWVPPGAAGSNADFIQACFTGTPAERAHFVPLFNGHETASDGLESAEQAIAGLSKPFDICILGMGLDAHTASWFPRSGGLETALNPSNRRILCAIDATGSEVAGEHTDRISLTYSAVASSRRVMLLLPSEEKLTVFKASIGEDPKDKPVAILERLADRLTVYGTETET